jgi:hypothetical protein
MFAKSAALKLNRSALRSTAASRARGKARLKAALFLLSAVLASTAVVLAYGAVRRAAARNSFFVVKTITLTGAKRLDERRLRGLLSAGLAGNIFTRDIERLTLLLEKLPAVQSASVRLKLPDLAEVSIVERRPVASVAVGGRAFLMDSSRRLIGEAPQGWSGGPAITGCKCAGSAGDWLPEGRLDDALKISTLFALDTYWHEKAATLDLSDPARTVVVTTSGVFLSFGQDRGTWREKFYEYVSARRISEAAGVRFAGYDLSFEGQVVGVGAEGSFAKKLTNKNKG